MINKHLFLCPELLSRLIFTQPNHGVYYVQALPRQEPRRALPEEIIRQLLILSLIHQYSYPEESIRIEYPVQMGRTKKRADVVVLEDAGNVHMVVEVKQQIDKECLEQLKSYMMVTGAAHGAAVSGDQFICLKKDASNRLIELADIPISGGSAVASGTSQGSASALSSTKLRTALQIEGIKRIGQTSVSLTIQGQTLNLSIVDFASYRKLQKRFLAAGVILAAEVKQSEWIAFTRQELIEMPIPAGRRSPEDEWAARISSWAETLQPDQRFIESRRIFTEALGEPAKNYNRRVANRLRTVMQLLGWEPSRTARSRGYCRPEHSETLTPTGQESSV